MAEFFFNEGNAKDISIDSRYNKTKIFISLMIIPENVDIRVAGYSRIFKKLKESVTFFDEPIDYAQDLYEKTIEILADATKFKILDSKVKASTIPITCKILIEAGDDLIGEFSINDSSNCTINSIFSFKLKFTKQD